MTVSELVAALEGMPQDAEVVVRVQGVTRVLRGSFLERADGLPAQVVVSDNKYA